MEEANKPIQELQQRNINISRRNTIWEDICDKVNADSKTRRTADEIKRRWQDVRRRAKEKMAYNKTSANKTGGGPAEDIPLSSTEQQVLLTFSDEQIVGIQGFDTCGRCGFSSTSKASCFSPRRFAILGRMQQTTVIWATFSGL